MKLRLLLRAQWDRAAGFALVILGLVVLGLGYLKVSGSVFVDEQLSYIVSGGLFGVSFIGIGVGLLISADLHDEWRKLDGIEAAIRNEPRPGIEIELPSERNHLIENASERHRSVRAGVSIGMAEVGSGHRPSGALAVPLGESGFRQMALVAGAGLCVAWVITFAGWMKVSETADWNRAVGGVSLAIVGLGLVVLAAASYPVRLRRLIVGRRAGLLAPWSRAEIVPEDDRGAPVAAAVSGASTLVFVAPGQTRYHLERCVMLQGRQVTGVSSTDLDPAMTPCGLCGPQ